MNTSGKTVILFFVLVAGCFVLAITLVPIDLQGPLSTVIAITVGTALLSFTFGLVTRDYSWTDRLWSTTPVGYAWIYAAAGALEYRWTITFDFAIHRLDNLHRGHHNQQISGVFQVPQRCLADYSETLVMPFRCSLTILEIQDAGIDETVFPFGNGFAPVHVDPCGGRK